MLSSLEIGFSHDIACNLEFYKASNLNELYTQYSFCFLKNCSSSSRVVDYQRAKNEVGNGANMITDTFT